MNVVALIAFLRGALPASEFRASILKEVQVATERLRVRGSSVPILFDENDGAQQAIGFSEVRSLCQAYVDGKLSQQELAYISDVLQLAHLADKLEFDDDGVFEMLFPMSDPEVNGVYDKGSALATIREIDSASNKRVQPDAASR